MVNKEQLKTFLKYVKDWCYAWLDSEPDKELLHILSAELGKINKAVNRKLRG